MKYLLIALFLISCGQEKDDSNISQNDQYTGKYSLSYSQVFNFMDATVTSFLLQNGNCILTITKSNGKYNLARDYDCTIIDASSKEEFEIVAKSEEKGIPWYEGKENTAIHLPYNSNIIPVDNSEKPGLKFGYISIQFGDEGLISIVSDKEKEGILTYNFYKKAQESTSSD